MNPVLHTLPLDWSGESIDNRVPGEWHDLADQYDLPFRVVVLRHGYFFSDSLKIIDGQGYNLKKDLDYQCIAFNGDAASKVAKDVCGVIVITNPNVHYILRIDAQMLGGPYCSVAPSIAEAALGLANTTRKIHWNNITGKPDDFRPNGHLHALWELYGFTPQVLQLKRMTAGFEAMVQKDFDGLAVVFDQAMLAMELLLADVDAQLDTHIADKLTNPHRDTKAKMVPSLGNVVNYPVASLAEARLADTSAMNRYATPWSMAVSIQVNFWDKFGEHTSNEINPHNVTAAQINVYTIGQWNNLAVNYVPLHATVRQASAIYGYTPNAYWTRLRTGNSVTEIDVTASRLTPGRFSNTPTFPGRDLFLSPDGNWYSVQDKFKDWEVVPTKIIPMYGSQVGSEQQAINICNATLTDTKLYPPGTIALFHIRVQSHSYTGNGSVLYVTNHGVISIVRLANGAWTVGTGGA